MTPVGLPHSEIPGSKRACRSPRHIAACHVFHRLSVPRHPPSTLSNLTIKCLDLMRSAASTETTSSNKRHSSSLRISLSTTRIQLSKKLRSRRPTLSAMIRSCSPLVCRTRDASRRSLPITRDRREFLACCGNLLNQKEVRPISALP